MAQMSARAAGRDAEPGRRGGEGARGRRGVGGGVARRRDQGDARRRGGRAPRPVPAIQADPASVSVVRYTAPHALPAAQQRQRRRPRRPRAAAPEARRDADAEEPGPTEVDRATPRSVAERVRFCRMLVTSSTRRTGSSSAPSDRRDSGRSSCRPERAPARRRVAGEGAGPDPRRPGQRPAGPVRRRGGADHGPEDNAPARHPDRGRVPRRHAVAGLGRQPRRSSSSRRSTATSRRRPRRTRRRPRCRQSSSSRWRRGSGAGRAEPAAGPRRSSDGPRPSCRPAARRARSAADRWTRRAHLPALQRLQALTHGRPTVGRRGRAVVEALTRGDLEVVGQMADSSNLALLCEVQGDAVTEAAAATGAPVHGSTSRYAASGRCGTSPTGRWPAREVAVRRVARPVAGTSCPPTVLRDGAAGGGVGAAVDRGPVRAVDRRAPGRHLLAPGGAGRAGSRCIDGEISGGRGR